MKLIRLISTLALIFSMSPLSAVRAEMASESFRVPADVISGGGAAIASPGFRSNSSLGQATPLMAPGEPPYSSSYDQYPGFWYSQQFAGLVFCDGDFDIDGDVDGSDLALFSADFGRIDCASGPRCEGDFDSDGDVDGSDLAKFSGNFGRIDCPTAFR